MQPSGSADAGPHRAGAQRAAQQAARRRPGAIRGNQRVVLAGVQMRRGNAFPRVKITVEPLNAAQRGDRGLVVGVARRRTGDRGTGRRSHRRRGERRRRGARAAARVRAEEHQGGSAADHRGSPGGERRADVGQRGVPVQQRGVGNLEGRAAIAQRGAHHRQHPAGEQDRGAGGDQQRPGQPADQHQHRDAVSGHAPVHPALHAGRHPALQPDCHRTSAARSATSRRSSPTPISCPTPRRSSSSRSRRRRRCKPTTAAGTSARSSPTARATTGPKAW